MTDMTVMSNVKSQMSKVFFVFLFIILATCYFLLATTTRADELEEIEKKLAELKKSLQVSQRETVTLESSFENLQRQLSDIQSRIAVIENEVDRKRAEVAEGEAILEAQQTILEERVRLFYKRSHFFSPLLLFLSQKSLASFAHEAMYQRYITQEDKKTIIAIVLYVKELEEKKKQLEVESQRLASVKKETDYQANLLQGQIAGAKAYQQQLTSQIAELTARQQEILARRQAALNLPATLGSGPLFCTDDRKIDPGFSPAFAFYTFGIPHRVGMNQYGAWGRANIGQSEEEILRAYYDNFELKKDYDSGITINVDGYGGFNIEDYVKRIYEMPSSWPMAALKAQAIAARSYALAYTDNGSRSICPTQKCQVFKPEEKGGAWNQAVEETRGWVMIAGGKPITAWYASTAGGFLFNSGDVWRNTTPWTKRMRDANGDVGSLADLQQKAYDRESPCFYSAQGLRHEYNKSAWLKSAEVADIVNVILLSRVCSDCGEKLYQTDKPHPFGGEVWSEKRAKQELKDRGVNPVNNVSDASVSVDFGLGKTNSITISTDGGSYTFSGGEFKNWFNLRAPANIQIVGPLFNVEKK